MHQRCSERMTSHAGMSKANGSQFSINWLRNMTCSQSAVQCLYYTHRFTRSRLHVSRIVDHDRSSYLASCGGAGVWRVVQRSEFRCGWLIVGLVIDFHHSVYTFVIEPLVQYDRASAVVQLTNGEVTLRRSKRFRLSAIPFHHWHQSLHIGGRWPACCLALFGCLLQLTAVWTPIPQKTTTETIPFNELRAGEQVASGPCRHAWLYYLQWHIWNMLVVS